MATQLATPIADEATTPPPAKRGRTAAVIAIVLVVGAVAVVAVNASSGAGTGRIANPDVSGAPRPVEPLFGFSHWLALHQIGTVVMMITLIVAVVVFWRRRPGHPVLLMVLATTLLVWQDPIMNWAPYAVYNPQLWHWPQSWPLVSLSPTVEPFIVVGYATFYMLPFFPAVLVLRRLQAGRPVDSFVWRHPLITLSLLILAIGFVFDAFLEIFLVRTQLYIYSQVIPWGSYAPGPLVPVPVDLGVGAGVHGDDPRGCAPLPGRHRTHTGGEAGAPSAPVPEPSCARHVRGHVRDRERRLPLSLWRWLRADP